MQIIWYGQECFKIIGDNATIIIEPFSAASGLRAPRHSGHIVLAGSAETAAVAKVRGADEAAPFIISGAGEYELRQAFVNAFYSKGTDSEAKRTTLYRIEIDNIAIGHLGYLDHSLDEKVLDQLDKIDVLFVPVSGKSTLNAKKATEIIGQLEPRIVIPMHYKISGLKEKVDPLENFCNEIGICPKEHLPKLRIARKDLPTGDMKVVLLEKA